MKVRRKPEPSTVLDAIQFRVGQPLPLGMHPADPRSEDQSPVLEQPDGAPSMADGDWIICYPSGERWRCSPEEFKDFYEEAIVEEDARLAKGLSEAWRRSADLAPSHESAARTAGTHDLTETHATESHAFQRFEHAMLNRTGGRVTGHLKVVCRCGWSTLGDIMIDQDPDATEARLAQLRAHIDEMLAQRRS